MRIKLTTEWVEWQCLAHRITVHILMGAHDNVASIVPEEPDGYRLYVFHAPEVIADAWRYEATYLDLRRFTTVEEAKEACLQSLIAFGMLDPLDLIMDVTCNASS